MNKEEKSKGIINDRFELIIREIQGLLAFGYLLMILIGMLFEAIYYWFFEINIFSYSDISDFILAPFRRPIILVLLGIAILVSFLAFRMDKWMEKRTPKLHRWTNFGISTKKWYSKFRLFTFLFLFITITFFYAVNIGKDASDYIFERAKPDVTLHINTGNAIQTLRGKTIGKNNSYYFLADTSNQIQILPLGGGVQKILPIRKKE